MSRVKKDINIEIGARLKSIREHMGYSPSDVAAALGIGDEHYRKLECGATVLTTERVYALHEKLNIDPTFLIIGDSEEEFDFDRCVTNCSREERSEILKRFMNYLRIRKKNENEE